MTYETDISTQQDTPQKDFWFSGQNEDDIGAQSDQSPQKSGQKETRRLTFPKHYRLLRRGEFIKVAKTGNRLVGKYLCIDYRPAPKGRLGISAPSRFGSAPERSRFKRLVREAYRHNYTALPPFELNVIPRQCAKKAHAADIAHEINTLLKSTAAAGR